MREWADGMVAAGYLERDALDGRLSLPAAHVATLATEADPGFFGRAPGAARCTAGLPPRGPRVPDRRRRGPVPALRRRRGCGWCGRAGRARSGPGLAPRPRRAVSARPPTPLSAGHAGPWAGMIRAPGRAAATSRSGAARRRAVATVRPAPGRGWRPLRRPVGWATTRARGGGAAARPAVATARPPSRARAVRAGGRGDLPPQPARGITACPVGGPRRRRRRPRPRRRYRASRRWPQPPLSASPRRSRGARRPHRHPHRHLRRRQP